MSYRPNYPTWQSSTIPNFCVQPCLIRRSWTVLSMEQWRAPVLPSQMSYVQNPCNLDPFVVYSHKTWADLGQFFVPNTNNQPAIDNLFSELTTGHQSCCVYLVPERIDHAWKCFRHTPVLYSWERVHCGSCLSFRARLPRQHHKRGNCSVQAAASVASLVCHDFQILGPARARHAFGVLSLVPDEPGQSVQQHRVSPATNAQNWRRRRRSRLFSSQASCDICQRTSFPASSFPAMQDLSEWGLRDLIPRTQSSGPISQLLQLRVCLWNVP